MRGLFLPVILLLISGSLFGITKASEAQDLKLSETIVSLNYHKVSLKEAFKSIESQTEFRFAYSYRAINLDRKVSVVVEHQSVEQVLKHLFKNKKVSWIQSGRSILLKKKERKNFQRLSRIKGQVKDAKTGETLPGVNILIKGTSVGTSTDMHGNYKISVPSEADTLVFSFISFQTVYVAIDGRSEINIEMTPKTIVGEELVVVGYGTEKQKNLTGAVNQISGKKLNQRTISNVVQGLQGLAPSMNISVGDAGGEPGATPNFNIRGIGSLSGGSPYVLVDGIPQDLSTVNPQDVENVSVLKGAAASAIYGSRAAFGVVLVTTKSGNRNTDTQFSYSTNIGWNAPTVLPEMANSLDYVQTFNQASKNAGQAAYFSDDQIQRIRKYMADPKHTPTTIPDPASPNTWGRNTYANANTDWLDVFYKPWAMNQTHNLNLNGGSKNIGYYFSGGFYNQGGQLRYGDDNFKRYNLMSKINIDVTDWLTININGKFTNRHIDMPYPYAQIGSYYHQLTKTMPVMPVRDPNGHIMSYVLNYVNNGGRDIKDNNELLGKIAFTLEPVKNWLVNADISYRQHGNTNKGYKKTVSAYYVNESTYPMIGTYPSNYANTEYEDLYHTMNLYTSYERQLNKHFLKGLVGYQVEELNYSSISGERAEILVGDIPSISTATGQVNLEDSKGSWASEGIFMRLNYNFDEKYLFEFNARYDGSSRFPSGNRFGFFPSISAGYNIAEENFWDSLRDKIGLLKLRFEYGSLGNQDVPDYLYINTLGVNTNLPWLMGDDRPLYVTAPGLISNDLTWETINTVDVGLDMEMLQNRLTFNFDWYNRSTTDMFGPNQTYPGVLGTAPPQKNNADLSTKGFEVNLSWRDNIGDVQYHIKGQLADHQTEIEKYNNETGYINDYYPGRKLGEIWGYTTAGIYQTDEEAQKGPDQSFFWSEWGAGDVQYVDMNGDNIINNGEQTLDNSGDLSVIGNSTPRYQYSFDLGLQWKGIDLSMLWQGVEKRDLALGGNYFWGISGGQHYTVFKSHLDYWTPENTDAYYPKPYRGGESAKNTQVQSGYLQNGAYLRLKNLQIGYNLSASWLNKINVKNLRVYFNGENLLTISPIMSTFDPEAYGGSWGNGKLYPIAKTFSVGMNLKF